MPDLPTPLPNHLHGMPPWLKAAIYLGVPSIIALFLVWTLTNELRQTVSEIRQTQVLQAQTLLTLQQALSTRIQDVSVDRRTINEIADHLDHLIRRTCVVAAETQEERTSCLEERRE